MSEQRARFPFYSPRIWHGMTAGVWFPLILRNGLRFSPRRYSLATTVSLVSILNSGLRAASELLYRKRAENKDLELAPLFVLGHWRTGTTLLHELFVRDPRFSYPTTFQCFAPHHFVLTHRVMGPMVNRLLPRTRPMDDMQIGHDRPQEDEFALLNLGVGSNYLDWAFPNKGDDYDAFLTLDDLSDAQLQSWRDSMLWFLKRLALVDSRQLVLKSPTHTARVRRLLEILPNAKFVHIVRDPLKFIPSTLRMWTRMADSLGLQIREREFTIDQRIDVFQKMYANFTRDRAEIPSGHLFEVRYEDLVQSPTQVMEEVYRGLDLGDFEPARAGIQDYFETNREFQGNKHEVSDEMRESIRNGCREYMDDYGYAMVPQA